MTLIIELETQDQELLHKYIRRMQFEDVRKRVDTDDEAYRVLSIMEHIKGEK